MFNNGQPLTPDKCFEQALRDAFNTFYTNYNKYKNWMENEQKYRHCDDDEY